MTQNERMSLPIWKKILLLIVSIIFFVIQITLLIMAFDFSFSYTASNVKWIYFLTLGIGFSFVLYILSKSISIHYKLTWSILILMFPLPFCMLYVLNGSSRHLSKRKMTKINTAIGKIRVNDAFEELKENDAVGGNLVRVVQHSTFAPVYKDYSFKYFSDVYEKYLDMLEEIKKAKHYIFMEYFITRSKVYPMPIWIFII